MIDTILFLNPICTIECDPGNQGSTTVWRLHIDS